VKFSKEVSPEGLEPSTLGLKGRCSTTELWALRRSRRNLKDLSMECKTTADRSDQAEIFRMVAGEICERIDFVNVGR
jgi:hypothetical protein